jgi:hypothetical protein
MSKIVVCDIDGTISKVGDRIKYLEQSPKDWDAFYGACGEDKPVENVIELIGVLYDGYNDIVFCSGRRESCREDTAKWIKSNVNYTLGNVHILLRKDGDYRSDTIVKKELLDNYLSENGYTKDDVAFILEDRSSVVKMWRDAGYTCLQVAEGDF